MEFQLGLLVQLSINVNCFFMLCLNTNLRMSTWTVNWTVH